MCREGMDEEMDADLAAGGESQGLGADMDAWTGGAGETAFDQMDKLMGQGPEFFTPENLARATAATEELGIAGSSDSILSSCSLVGNRMLSKRGSPPVRLSIISSIKLI